MKNQASGLLSIARNAFYLVGSRGLTIFARAAYIVILARFLGPEMYGIFAYGTSWYLAFLPLTYLGLDVIAGNEVGRRSVDAREVVADTLVIRVFVTLLAALLCALLGVLTEQEPLPRTLLLIFSVALLGRSIALWSDGVFVAYEEAQKSFYVHLAFRPAEVVLGIVVLLAGGGVVAVALLHAVAWWAHALVSLVMAVRLNGVNPGGIPSSSRILPLLAAGIPLGLFAVLEAWLLNGPLVAFRLDGGTEADLGQLSLVLQALMIGTAVGTVVAKAALPVVARSVGRGDDKDRVFAEEMLHLSAWLGLGGWLLGTAWGPALVSVVFGPGYAATGELLGPVLALFYPFVGAYTLAHVLMARKETWRLVVCSFFAALLMTGIQLLAGPSSGYVGVLLAMSVGFLAWLIGLAGLLHHLGSLRIGHSFAGPGLLVLVVVGTYHLMLPIGVPGAFAVSLALFLVIGLFGMRRRLQMFLVSGEQEQR